MYCKNCGSQISGDEKFCPKCGAIVNQAVSLQAQAHSDKAIKWKHINTLLAIVAIILMFLPLFVINAKEMGYSNKLQVSGFDVGSGIDFTDGTSASRNFFAWLMVMVPIASLIINHIKRLFRLSKKMLLAAPIICICSVLLSLPTFSAETNVTVSADIGFWLYFLLTIVWLVAGYLQYKNMPLSKDSLSNLLNNKK